jgi:hypothetical protein
MRIFIAFTLLLVAMSSASAFTVTITAKIEGSERPIVVGVTNLPDGTELMIELSRKESSYMAQSKATVSGGLFRTSPFSQKGVGLNSGTYTVEVSMPLAAVQPPAIWPIIGNKGSKLEGPLVRRSSFGGNFVQYKTTFKTGIAAPDADKASRVQTQADKHSWWLQSCKDTCNMTKTLARKRNESFDFDRCYYKCVADEPAKK